MAASPPKPGPSPNEDVFSLEDLDILIDAVDPNFRGDMEQIKSVGVHTETEIESLDVGPDEDVPEKEDTEKTRAQKILDFLLSPIRQLRIKIGLKYTAVKNRLFLFLHQMVQFIIKDFPDFLRYLKSVLTGFLRAVLAFMKQHWATLAAFSMVEKAALSFAILAMSSVFFFALKTLTGDSILPKFGDEFIHSLEEGANFEGAYKMKSELQDMFQAFPEVEFFVLLNKVIVNLKPDSQSGPNPMGIYEMYLGLDSQDTAVEVKDREQEILDIIQRTLEGFTYTEVSTKAGKEKMKLAIREQVNKVLNQGRVFHVYFNAFITKM